MRPYPATRTPSDTYAKFKTIDDDEIETKVEVDNPAPSG